MAAQQSAPISGIAGESVEFPSRRGNRLVGDLHRVGTGAGRWLVLCHGMESTRGGTKQQAIVQRMVPRGYNVLRFDFSFVGDSEGDYEDLTVTGEVGDVLGALDFMSEFAASDCTLVGSSLGGLVALLAAAQAPHVVSRVATIAAVADTRLFTENLGDKAIADWRRRGRHRIGSGFLKPTFLDDVLRIDAPATLAKVAMPVLVMHGDADTVVPLRHAHIIADSVSGPVKVETFAGVGHRFEEPGALERLLDVLERWLEPGAAPAKGG
ncbi:MAG TPA: alpha/beta hydrolase [Candidatus Limnocylindrales bacterium]|nr:alpha/beta hydrolase [Candidatus Limnocylindrales bacterium]